MWNQLLFIIYQRSILIIICYLCILINAMRYFLIYSFIVLFVCYICFKFSLYPNKYNVVCGDWSENCSWIRHYFVNLCTIITIPCIEKWNNAIVHTNNRFLLPERQGDKGKLTEYRQNSGNKKGGYWSYPPDCDWSLCRLLCDIRHHRQMSCSLDRCGKLSLMLSAVAGDSSRKNLASLGDISS